MPLSMDLSDTNTGASDAASADDTSTADPGDAAPGTADMTSQNPIASAMNPSRLLRTALFSALGLLVTGGLMAVQAQTVVVDEDGGEDETTISAGLNTLDSQEGSGGDGAATLVVVAGDYSDTDAIVDVGDQSLSNITDLTFEIRRDEGTNTEQLTIEALDLSGTVDVTLESTNGSEFMFVQSAGGRNIGTNTSNESINTGDTFDLALQGGTLSLAEADVLRFQNSDNGSGSLNVYRTDASDVSGEAPNYAGDIDRLEYDAGSDITAGNELGMTSLSSADVSLVSTLAVDGSNLVEFTVNSLTVGTFDGSSFASGDVTVNGDFSVGSDVTVGDANNLTVSGTFQIDNAAGNSLTVSGSVNSGSTVGDLVFTGKNPSISVDRQSGTTVGDGAEEGDVSFNDVTAKFDASTSPFIQDGGNGGDDLGTVDITGTLTLNVVQDDDDTSEDHVADVDLSNTSSFDIASVDVNSRQESSGSDVDETLLDILNDDSGAVTAGGEINAINNQDNDSSIELTGGTLTGQLDNGTEGDGTAGSVTISGDVTYDYVTASGGAGSGDAPILNSATPVPSGTEVGATIQIDEGATLTIDDTDGNGDTSQDDAIENNGIGGITGGGTLAFVGNGGDIFDVEANVGGQSTPAVSQSLTAAVNASVELNILDGGATKNVDVGDLTASANVTLGDGGGDIELSSLTANSDGDNTSRSIISVGNGNGKVTVSGDVVANAEEIDLRNASGSPDVDFQGNVDLNANQGKTIIDLDGITAHFKENFDREADPNAELQTSNTSTVEFNGPGGATFSPGSKFTIDGNFTVDKTGGILTLTEALAVDGNVDIDEVESQSEPNNEFRLEDNLFLSGGSADFTLDADATSSEEFFIIVDGSGPKTFKQTTGSASLTSLRVDGNGDQNDVIIDNDLTFTSTVDLENGGIRTASGTDFSPTLGGSPVVRRNLGGSNTQIDATTNSNATFNDEGNAYNLAYDGGTGADVGSEFTADVRDLTVEGDGTSPQLTEGETLNGALTVAAGAEIVDKPSNDDTGGDSDVELTLSGDQQNHSVVGRVASNDDPVDLEMTGKGSTLAGTTDNDPDGDGMDNDAEIDNLTIIGSENTVSEIQQINGTLDVEDGGSLTSLALANAADDSFDGNSSGDARVGGAVTVNDTLSLASDVEVVGAVQVDGSGSNAFIDFGTSDLFATGGSSFDGNDDATYESDGGTLRFAENSVSNFGTAGVSIPRVSIEANVTTQEGVAVSDSLGVDGSVLTVDQSAGADSLSFSGTAYFTGTDPAVSTGSSNNNSVFISKGTTVNLDSDAYIENFTVDSGGSETRVEATNGNTLFVERELELRSGDLQQATDVELDSETANTSANAGDDVTLTYGTDGGQIDREDGYLILDDNDATSFSFEQNLTVPFLRVASGAGQSSSSGHVNYGDDNNLLVGSELDLRQRFNFGTSGGSLEITDGSTIARTDDFTGSNVLSSNIVFPSNGTYNVEYTGTSGPINTGRELDTADGTIADVEVDNSVAPSTNAAVVVSDVSGNLTENVVVNGTLNLTDGSIRHGNSGQRQIAMADESSLERNQGAFASSANFADDDPVAHASENASYKLVYDSSSDPLTATSEEFLDTGRISVVTLMSSGADLELLPGDRTIDSLRIENESISSDVAQTRLTDGAADPNEFTLTVEGEAELKSGELASGLLNSEEDITVSGADVSSDVEAAGDFAFSSGDLGQVDLTFDGSSDQAFQLARDAELLNLGIDTGGNVNLTGASIGVQNRLTLRSGLLIVEDNELVALSQQGSEGPLTTDGSSPTDQDEPATVDRAGGSGSHIVGTVQHGFHAGAGNPEVTVAASRFEYPVGIEGEFRQLAITFDSDDPLSTDSNVRVTVSDENPGGTLGLSDIDGVGSYPEQFFRVDATTGISASQTFDIELETGTQGFTEKFSDADNLRVIRRFVGDTEENRWRLQGQPSEYQNALFTRNGKEFTSVRAQQSTGGLVTQGTVFALGLPGRVPEFIASPGDQSVDENESTGDLTFEARSRDVGQDVTLSLGDLPSSVDPDSVSFEAGSPDDTTSATLEFTPGFEGVDRELTFTVNAEDGDGTTSSSLTVSVADVAQDVAFADGSAPSDADGTVARDTARSSDDPATFTVTAEPEDPSSSGSDLSFSTDVGWATAEATSASDNQATGTVTLEPGFAEAQSAAQGDGSLDVQVTATDDNTGESASGSASVDVRFDRALGDVDGSGSITSFDASLALSIAVGKTEVNEEPIVDAQVRAADFVPPSEGDTLDAEAGDVNSFDALQIFQSRDGAGGATAAATSAAATSKASRIGQADGGIRVGEMEKKGGTSVVSIVLDENAGGVQAADVEVDLSDAASVKDVQTSLPKGWISSHNTEDGTLKIGMAGERALPSGKIATVQLDASGDDPFSDGNYRLNGSDLKAMTVEAVPSKFSLGSNYPNPVESETTIEYELKESSSVTLEVYNTLGQKVATLVDQKQEAGDHSVAWKAGDDLSSGVYFYRMQAGDFTETKRITVVR